MRRFALGLMLMVLPLLVAGKQVEVRIDVPAPLGAAISAAVSQEVNDDIQDAIADSEPAAKRHLPAAIIKGSDDAFIPDIFPSQRAAIRFAVEQWAKQVVLTAKEVPTTINISTPGDAHSEAIRELQGAVQSQLLGANCQIHQRNADVHPTPQASPGVAWAEFEVVPGDKAGSGRVMLKGNVPAVGSASAAFVSTPWADNFTEYVNGRPQVERWIVGQSQRTCTKPMEATNDAIRQAADGVSGLLHTRLSGMRHTMLGVDEGWLAAKIQGELERGGLIKDRFVQRYERPYGTLWREAILVDVSESNIDYLAAGVLAELRVRHATERNTAISVLGLLVVIYMLYLLVNAVTKGYFVWRLRTMAVVLAAIGVVILMWFIAMPTQHDSSVQPASHAVPGYRMEY